MSKFKVGDKVLYGNNKYTITEIGKLVDGVDIFKLDDRTYIVGYGELVEYKTPHQELLDLGWVALNKANGVLTYLLNADGSLHPEIIELSFEGKRYYTTLRIIDLQLAKILVRYLEELE